MTGRHEFIVKTAGPTPERAAELKAMMTRLPVAHFVYFNACFVLTAEYASFIRASAPSLPSACSNRDTSHLGEYSNRAESAYAIDRRHSLDCPVNSGTDGKLLWFTSSSGRIELQMTMEQAKSASHSGECDDDCNVV
jgi:hypothetical protein